MTAPTLTPTPDIERIAKEQIGVARHFMEDAIYVLRPILDRQTGIARGLLSHNGKPLDAHDKMIPIKCGEAREIHRAVASAVRRLEKASHLLTQDTDHG